jgi:protein gp37
MSEKTKIAWCDSTVNFWRGCDKVSAGCKECYITGTMPFRLTGQKHGDPRVHSFGAIKAALALNELPWICDACGEAFDQVQQHRCPTKESDLVLTDEVNWHRRRIFSLSLGDWLDDKVPIEWLAEMLDTIRQCDRVIWILCSKRLELWSERLHQAMRVIHGPTDEWISGWLDGDAPSNIILLASVEDQANADLRIPQLLAIPATYHGLSLEPLLGPVNLSKWISWDHSKDEYGIKDSTVETELNWLIIGGESGPRARPCHIEWIASLVNQGATAGIPTFVKQLGQIAVCDNANMFDWPEDVVLEAYGTAAASCRIVTDDKKGGDYATFPDQLKIREFCI